MRRVIARRLSPKSRGFLVMLAAITALAPLGIDTSLPALPVMARSLHTSDGMVGATLGAFMLAFAFGQLLVGPLADRYGRRAVLIAGLAVFTLSGWLCAIATNIDFLLGARFVQGLGACAGNVVVRAIIRDVFTERAQRARMQAYTSAISGVVPMLAPLLGVVLLTFGWRTIFGALIAGGVLLWTVTVIWLPESMPAHARAAQLSHVFRSYGAFLALPRSIGLCLLLAFSFAGVFAFISASPFVLVRELGLSNGGFGVAFAIASGAILAGSWVAGALAHRFNSERLLAAASLAAGAIGSLAFALNAIDPHAPPAWAFVGIMAANAFTFGIIVPTAYAVGLEPAGAMAGVASGLMGATQTLGGAFGSTIDGVLPFAVHLNVGLSAGIAGLGTAAAYLYSRRSPAARLRTG